VRADDPLTREELERLWRWERHMVRFHAIAMTLLVVCAAATYLYSDIAWVRRSLLVLVVGLVVAATFLQVREKCPRCGARLRTKSLLRLPEKCGVCGAAFERPPAQV
jgi:hypothetical protein